MTPLVGCVLSYALLVPGALSAPDAATNGELCAVTLGSHMLVDRGGDDTLGTCPVSAEVMLHVVAAAAGTTTTYSNPIEVDCPAPAGGSEAATAPSNQGEKSDWFRGCAVRDIRDVRIYDFRYRVSRFPDSERQSGALGPQRERRTARSSTLATGLPPRGGNVLSIASAPLAVYAVGGLVPPLAAAISFQGQRPAPTRVLDPLERPPRA
ncbi:MAG: hypothetical protein ABJA82_07690 [Myxococcales bacterium]